MRDQDLRVQIVYGLKLDDHGPEGNPGEGQHGLWEAGWVDRAEYVQP